MRYFQAIVVRDLRLGFRAGGGALHGLLFFAVTGVLFALAVGPNVALLSSIAAPVLWTAALLSTQISLDQIWREDREDGSLDVLIETTELLALTALVKTAAHWLTNIAPILALTPGLALMFNMPASAFVPLFFSLIVGTPGLALIGCVAGALSVSLPRAHLLIAIIVGPLYTPILIFGAGAALADLHSPQFSSNILLLLASVLFAAIFSPLASAAALRSNLD